MKKPSTIGKQHALDVYEALKMQLNDERIVLFSEPIQKTVYYIVERYPTIISVKGKYDFPLTDDEPDLKITLKNGETIKINLFSLKGGGKIQPKNLGAKSFISKYFHATNMQQQFNEILEQEYKAFLQAIVETKELVNPYDTTMLLKKKVKQLYPSFNEDINPIRTNFLFNLRESLFYLLQKEHGFTTDGIEAGVKELMLLDSINIITRYKNKNKCSSMEEWQPTLQLDAPIQFYKKGNDTVGIRIGQEALTLRLKFESSPTSSLKLATSFDVFPIGNEREKINNQSLKSFGELTSNHPYTPSKTDGNAVGKCNEALVYARFIAKYPTIYQIDSQEYLNMYETYAPKVQEKAMNPLQSSSAQTLEVIEQYLTQKYGNYTIESIQLVPQSYLKNRLDTADLKLTLMVGKGEKEVDFSLKAIAKAGSLITMKNPGIGTILGPGYFSIGTMADVVEQVKEQYVQGKLSHTQCLEEVSLQLGTRLKEADQFNLRKGLVALFGIAPTVVTFYEAKKCVVKEHNKIETAISVFPQQPTAINTLLKWNIDQDQIKLRVKFSAGQHKGWSSLKLVCEYVVR